MDDMAWAMLGKELFGNTKFGEVGLMTMRSDDMCTSLAKLGHNMGAKESVSPRDYNRAINPKRFSRSEL